MQMNQIILEKEINKEMCNIESITAHTLEKIINGYDMESNNKSKELNNRTAVKNTMEVNKKGWRDEMSGVCCEVSSYFRQQENEIESSWVKEKVNDLKEKIKEERDKYVTKSRVEMNKVNFFEEKHNKKVRELDKAKKDLNESRKEFGDLKKETGGFNMKPRNIEVCITELFNKCLDCKNFDY